MNQISQILTWVIIGIIAGYLAGRVAWGKRFSPLMAIVIGLIGAVVGGLLFKFFNVRLPFDAQITISLADIIAAFIGAIIVLFIVGAIDRRRG